MITLGGFQRSSLRGLGLKVPKEASVGCDWHTVNAESPGFG